MRVPLLEVTVTGPRDVAGALDGGADRLHLRGEPSADGSGLSPRPALVSQVCHESDLPVVAVLRQAESRTVTSADLDRLAELGRAYLACGAAAVSYGFLDDDLGLDERAHDTLAAALDHTPWTCHGVVDASLAPRATWTALADRPGLLAVQSAGSPQGLAVGYDDLLALVRRRPAVAELVMPGGGLVAEQVPWLVRAGVRSFHLDAQVRPGGSWRADVDAGLVRSWRRLLDDEAARPASSPTSRNTGSTGA